MQSEQACFWLSANVSHAWSLINERETFGENQKILTPQTLHGSVHPDKGEMPIRWSNQSKTVKWVHSVAYQVTSKCPIQSKFTLSWTSKPHLESYILLKDMKSLLQYDSTPNSDFHRVSILKS